MEVRKSDGSFEEFDRRKLGNVIRKAFKSANVECNGDCVKEIIDSLYVYDGILCSSIRKQIEERLGERDERVLEAYKAEKQRKKEIQNFVEGKKKFIASYKKASNTANATVDDNSNVANKNIAVINAEIHKSDNIQISRAMIMDKLKELYPDFNSKRYVQDLENHVIYKHDESSFAGISPYCCSITLYPFLTNGIKGLGGLSAAPKNLDSFCGMYCNLIFAVSSQFAGAVATSEFLMYFTYFCKKEWGEDFYLKPDTEISKESKRVKTIRTQIHQYWQQVIYTISQPSAARGYQSAFVNFSYFDKPFFDGMFGDFYFPDGTRPDWESLKWIQKEFMMWFNKERLRCILTFPVESVTLLFKDGKFADEEMFNFVCEEYARGHSFFTYISDTVDSLSSCCFAKDTKVVWKSSTRGVNCTTLEELHNMKWEPDKKNLKIMHNGCWVSGKSIKLPNKPMYKVRTYNNKEYYMTEDHINVTLDGEKETRMLTTGDYLLFNTIAMNAVPENDEHLSYEMGFVVGAFLGDGSFGPTIGGTIYDINFSQNANKAEETIKNINICAEQLGIEGRAKLSTVYNNVYPIRISSKELVAFIQKWTNWKRGTYAFNKQLNLNCLVQSLAFRQGILKGWHQTDGGNSNRCYTSSKVLAENMELLITSLGLQSIINVSDRTDEKVIIRNEAYKRNYPLYCVRFYEPSNCRKNRDENGIWVKRNNSIFFRIKSIERVVYSDEVYCIECKNAQEPYFTLPSGLITHNCRLKNKLQTKEFSFTNGNIGLMTGSKSVITMNLARIIQDWWNKNKADGVKGEELNDKDYASLKKYINKILDRVYKYHTAYNELLWDMYDSDLLPVYKAGFIDLNKQYLTIGINGLNQAAEFLGIDCTDNEQYSRFCREIFSNIKEQNLLNKVTEGKHKLTFNTECVPAESLAAKNYKWDKADGYWVPEDTNLYASYIFKPNDTRLSILDKIRMHGSRYIGDYLDGGSACHVNLDAHLTAEQYRMLILYAAHNGCQYFTWNIPNCQCEDCGYIAKQPFTVCPNCGSKNVALWDRIIGYLTKIKNWSEARQIEQTTRVYADGATDAEKIEDEQ